MKQSDLLVVLECLKLRKKDEPGLKALYDELLDAYNECSKRPDYRVPIFPVLNIINDIGGTNEKL